MKGNKILYFIVIILALLVGLMGYSYLSSQKTTVYMFNNSYQAGTKFDSSMVTAQSVDVKMLNGTSVKTSSGERVSYITQADINNLRGKYIIHDVYAGTHLTNAVVGDQGSSPVEMKLSANMVGVTVKTDSIIVGSPYIKPDALVNVYVAYKEKSVTAAAGNAAEVQKEKLLFEKIRVLDILAAKSDDESMPQPIGITLELTPDQGTVLNYYAEYGSIRLGVVKPGEYNPIGNNTYTEGDPIKQTTGKR